MRGQWSAVASIMRTMLLDALIARDDQGPVCLERVLLPPRACRRRAVHWQQQPPPLNLIFLLPDFVSMYAFKPQRHERPTAAAAAAAAAAAVAVAAAVSRRRRCAL